MKFLLAIAFIGFVAAADEVCHDDVVQACSPTAARDSISCNSLMSGFNHVHADLQTYVNSQLATSYDYLLLSTHFDSYQKNRPGFKKLFDQLSEKAWENAIGLIKHITKRGGSHNFFTRHEVPSTITNKKNRVEVDELHALALALDSEKKLASDAHHIHRRVSHLDNHEHYDPEITQYIEEDFLEDQSDRIRTLSGYANDLSKLLNVPDPSLGVYLFDEYLQKQIS